jgi:DNA-3-methyladenine glycosylase II
MKRLNSASLLQAVDELASRDETLAKILVIHGPPPLWEREPGFHTLIHIILEQQVSLASAQAAYNRLTIAVRVVTPDNFLKLNDEELLKIGFSRQKNRYGRELALAILGGSLDLPGMDHLEDDEARAELMKVKGIGAWTANIYLLMALGRPDIWPSGDLALLVAIQRAKGLFNRPTSEEGQSMSTAWQPWRAVAARLLWHYYLSEPAKRSHI